MKKILSLFAIPLLVLTGFVTSAAVAPQQNIVAATIPGDLDTARATILAQVNQERSNAGLPPLQLNSAINTVAQNCSTRQADNAVMAHCNDFSNNIPAGWVGVAENVGQGYSYSTVVSAWMASEGHRANILTPGYTDIGIGYALDANNIPYYTQNFANYPSTVTIPSRGTTPVVVNFSYTTASITYDALATTGNAPVTVTVNVQPTGQGQGFSTVLPYQPGTPINATNLTPGETYNITLTPSNSQGSGQTSPTTQLTTLPAETVTVNATSTTNTVTVNWGLVNPSVASNITGYQITVGGTTTTVSANTTTTTISGLQPGTEYIATVTPMSNNVAVAPASTSVTTDTPTLPAPTNLDVTVTNTQTTITWDAPSDATDGFTYDVNLYTDGSTLESTTNTGNTTAIIIPNNTLTKGVEYTVTVTATDENAQIRTSSVKTFRLAYGEPGVPTNPVATLTNPTEIEVTWNAPTETGDAPELTYLVEVYEDGTPVTNTTTTNTNIVFDEETIRGGHEYYFTIQTKNADATSPYVTTETVNTPAPPAAPETVTDVTVNATTTGFNIAWTEPEANGSPITSYHVVVATLDNQTVSDTTVNTLNTTVNNLNPGTFYFVKVSAVNAVGEGTPGTRVVKTLAAAPGAITIQNATFSQTNFMAPVITIVNPLTDGGDPTITYNVTLLTPDGPLTSTHPVNAFGTTTTIYLNPVTYITDASYLVIVTATNSGGNTAPVSAVLNAPVPSAPVTGLQFNNKTLTWAAPTNTGTYGIHHYKVVISTDEIVYTTTTTDTTLTFTNQLQTGVNYRATVTPYTYPTGVLEGNSSSETFTIEAPPVEPATPSPVPSGTYIAKNGVLTAEWETPTEQGTSPITGYQITVTDGNYSETKTVTETTATFNVPVTSTSFTVTVTAVNPVGASAPTTLTGTVIPPEPVTPSAPTNLTRVITSVNSVTLNWNPPTNNGGAPIENYTVLYTIEGENFGTSVNGTTATITNLPADKTIIFNVVANNTAGAGEVAHAAPVTTAPAELPTPLTEEEFNQALPTAVTLTATRDGDNIIVTINGLPNESWVAGYAYSEPVPLQWSLLGNNQAVFNIAGLPNGNHHLAVYSTTGDLLGVVPFTVGTDTNNGGNGNTGGNTGGNTNNGGTGNTGGNNTPTTTVNTNTPTTAGNTNTTATPKTKEEKEELARTGGELPLWVLLFSGVATLTGAGLLRIRRKQTQN